MQRTKPEKSPFRSHPEIGEGDLAVAILARAGYQEVAATGKPGEEDFLANLAADWTSPTSPAKCNLQGFEEQIRLILQGALRGRTLVNLLVVCPHFPPCGPGSLSESGPVVFLPIRQGEGR